VGRCLWFRIGLPCFQHFAAVWLPLPNFFLACVSHGNGKNVFFPLVGRCLVLPVEIASVAPLLVELLLQGLLGAHDLREDCIFLYFHALDQQIGYKILELAHLLAVRRPGRAQGELDLDLGRFQQQQRSLSLLLCGPHFSRSVFGLPLSLLRPVSVS
jgi:hypothetical protein